MSTATKQPEETLEEVIYYNLNIKLKYSKSTRLESKL